MSLADKPINPCEVEYSVSNAQYNVNELKSYKELGMTLREYYAGLAMQGIITGITEFARNEYTNGNKNIITTVSQDIIVNRPQSVAEIAVVYADALIAQLEELNGQSNS